ncbi:MAG: cobalamin B12-binding domain-containing protein [Myxococcales bacterium]|nr:cobalamin B12-binding domain-containing protein [Myxococcales bacterium]
MTEILLTTTRAADLLQVHESTIKRWCNNDEIVSSKTPGGHRRILLEDLLQFAREREIPLALQVFEPFESAVWWGVEACREQGDFAPINQLAMEWISGTHPQLLEPLWLYMNKMSDVAVEDIMDRCIRSLMFHVGSLWEVGQIDIGQEHLYTQLIVDALHSLRKVSEIPSQESKTSGLRAIVGCSEGEQHQIGALCTRIVLERLGWQVFYLGANVPIEAYARAQKKYRAQMVCVSFVPPRKKADALRCMRVLSDLYDEAHPYHLLLGGSALEGEEIFKEGPFVGVNVFTETKAFRDWTVEKFSQTLEKQEGTL